jgi:Tfp pilus assembly protein PilO
MKSRSEKIVTIVLIPIAIWAAGQFFYWNNRAMQDSQMVQAAKEKRADAHAKEIKALFVNGHFIKGTQELFAD